MDDILSKIYGDNRFEVNNNQKYILVIGMTGEGKSSFINFMTDKDKDHGGCEVSDSAETCTHKYHIVDCIYYCGSTCKKINFIDTPGLDDPEGDKKNIEEIIKFRNSFPRINAVIYCQKLDNNRFSHSAKILLKLITDLYPDPNIFKQFIIVRTRSSSQSSNEFEENKKVSFNFIKTIKEKCKIDDQLEIKQYYVDSKYRDNDSKCEKIKILDILSKMDPIFKGIKILDLNEVIICDSENSRYEIRRNSIAEYTDFDGTTRIIEETDSEIQDFNGIKEVEVERNVTNEFKRCLFCKSWKIIYSIYHINTKNERIKVRDEPFWQWEKNEDKSNELKEKIEKNLNLSINDS